MALLLVIVIMTTVLVCTQKRCCSHHPLCLQPCLSHHPRYLRGRKTWGLGVRYICIQSQVTRYDLLGTLNSPPQASVSSVAEWA